MINPTVIIIAAALLLSAFVICIINKPKKPVITGTMIFILLFFVLITWLIDSCISTFSSVQQFTGFVSFVTMLDNPTYVQLEEAFETFKNIDIVLFILSLISLIGEAMIILKGGRNS